MPVWVGLACFRPSRCWSLRPLTRCGHFALLPVVITSRSLGCHLQVTWMPLAGHFDGTSLTRLRVLYYKMLVSICSLFCTCRISGLTSVERADRVRSLFGYLYFYVTITFYGTCSTTTTTATCVYIRTSDLCDDKTRAEQTAPATKARRDSHSPSPSGLVKWLSRQLCTLEISVRLRESHRTLRVRRVSLSLQKSQRAKPSLLPLAHLKPRKHL